MAAAARRRDRLTVEVGARAAARAHVERLGYVEGKNLKTALRPRTLRARRSL